MPLVQKGAKPRIADFVHGADGLGNQNFLPPEGKPIEDSAAAFLVQQAKLNPGKVTVVALGPLTNVALVCDIRAISNLAFSCYSSYHTVLHDKILLLQAIQLDPEFSKNIGQIVLLGGAFAVNGNVNPAAEANVSLSNL